jgi:nucleotide-binding universal stress UspA family protein
LEKSLGLYEDPSLPGWLGARRNRTTTCTDARLSIEDAEILLLRISTNPAAEFSFSDPALADSLIQKMEAETLAYMQSARGKLQRAGFRTSFLIRQGAIAESILRVAAECQADVIVMSTHGRSGVKRWLLGSIADRVVTHSDFPVLLIRPKIAG